MKEESEDKRTLPNDVEILERHLLRGHIGTWVFTSINDVNALKISQNFLHSLGYDRIKESEPLNVEKILVHFVHLDDQLFLQQVLFPEQLTEDDTFNVTFRMLNGRTNEWQLVHMVGEVDGPVTGDYRSFSGVISVVHNVSQQTSVTSPLAHHAVHGEAGVVASAQKKYAQTMQILQDFISGPNKLPAEQLLQTVQTGYDFCFEHMRWFKAIVDSTPFAVAVIDTVGAILYLNKGGLQFYGAGSMAEIIGQAESAWAEQYLEESSNESTNSLQMKQFTLHHKKSGKVYEGYSAPMYDAAGVLLGSVKILQDVTTSYEVDERVRIMLNANPLASNFWGSDYQNIDCNDAVCSLFGIESREEYLANFTSFSPEVQPNGEPSSELSRFYIEKAFTEGMCVFDWMHQKLDGTPISAEITLVRVERPQGAIVVGYIRDLTKLKKAENSLEKERELLQLVMDSSPVCFLIVVGNTIRYATPYTTHFFGVDVGDSIVKIYADVGQHGRLFEELVRTGSVNDQVTTRGADGNLCEMHLKAFLAEYYGESCTMVWLDDVTELHEQERNLREARDLAEKNTEAKGVFLANMSHEIRTPMNAILGMIHLVLDTELSVYQRDYLGKAVFATKALLRIINDILDFSKIEAHKMAMEEIDFSIVEVMQGIESILRTEAEVRNLSFKVNVASNIPLFATGDPLRLNQILTNLASNAIKFTPEGGVEIRAQLVSSNSESVVVLFEVEDSGIGLSSDQIEGLFAPFSQVDYSVTRKYGGTGLGLAISKSLVEMMHGSISYKNAPEKGSIFSFTATFGAAVEKAVCESSSDCVGTDIQVVQQKISEGILHGKRILVVEDNEMNGLIALEILQKEGLFVELSVNGAEAIEKVQKEEFDLIFMDIQMPVMDGLTATQKLRESNITLPIVAMTAHAMVGDKERSISAGMNDHLTKPLDVAEVLMMIARWLFPELFSKPVELEVVKEKVPPTLQEHTFPDFIIGLDLKAGLAHTKGDVDEYKELLLALAAKIPTSFDNIATSMMVGQPESLLLQLHGLRVDVVKVGGDKLGRLMQEMIVAVRQVTYQPLFVMLDKLEVLLIQLERAILDAFPQK